MDIKQIDGRTNYYFNGLIHSSISADANFISGLIRLEPKSEKLSWVVYDVNNNSLINTGVEIPKKSILNKDYLQTQMSPDGKIAVLFFNQEEGYYFYNLANSRLNLVRMNKQEMATFPIVMGIDGLRNLIVIGDSNGKVELWNFETGRSIGEFNTKLSWLHSVGFLPDGRVYIVKAYSDRIWVWDPHGFKNQFIELDHTDEVWSLSFSSESNHLISLGDDNKIKLWDLDNRNHRVIGSSESLVSRGRFSPNQSLFAACDFSGYVQIWETKNWNLIKSKKVSSNRLRSLAWGPNSDFLVCVGNGNEINEFSLKDDSVHKYPVSATCFDVVYSSVHDEFLINVQDASQKLLFMKFPGGELKASLNSVRLPTRFALDPTSDRVAVGFDEGGFGIISLVDRTLDFKVGMEESSGGVIELVFTTDGRNLITSVTNNKSLIYDATTWEKIGFLEPTKSDIHAMAFSGDGRKFATGDMSGKIKVLELTNEFSHKKGLSKK